MKYLELEGVCKNCLGCNKLEILYFKGVEKCKFSTEKVNFNTGKQLKIEYGAEKFWDLIDNYKGD